MTAVSYQAEWRRRAACRSADPDLFFPVSAAGPSVAEIAGAKRVCARCEVRHECRDFALATRQQYGVWGGTTPEERRLLARQRAQEPVWVAP